MIKNNIKLVVADLDGTLLHDDKSMDRLIVEFLNNHQNIKFTICSGRNYHIVQDIVASLDIQLPYILNNGANMWQQGKCLYNASINAVQLAHAFYILEQNHVSYIAYTNASIYVFGNIEPLQRFIKRLEGKCEIIYNASNQDIRDQDIYKVVMIDSRMKDIAPLINQHCNELSCVQSENDVYAINSKLASKGKTLQILMNMMNLTKDEVLVFGDNYNDIPMFEVGVGVAMGNAYDSVKQKARYIAKSNNEDGVSTFLKELFH